MALHSMTGFGRGGSAKAGYRVEVELSAVNRKQLDVRLSLAPGLQPLESRLQELIGRRLQRGSVNGFVRLSGHGAGEDAPCVDEALAGQYLAAVRRLGRALKLDDNIGMATLLALPGVVRLERRQIDADALWPIVERAAGKALDALVAMRRTEGRSLARDLLRHLAKLAGIRDRIGRIAPAVPRRYAAELRKRIGELQVSVPADDPRLLKEIALFADRADVSEELVRLQSHLEQFGGQVRTGAGVGRTLDFLCQELFREINTIGSKANDARLSSEVIRFKTILERMREQVQNVE